MLQKQQDMVAIGDGLAAEDDTHVARAWLQAKARFGRRNGERRSPYRHIFKMNGHSCFSFSLSKAFLRAASREAVARLGIHRLGSEAGREIEQRQRQTEPERDGHEYLPITPEQLIRPVACRFDVDQIEVAEEAEDDERDR